MGHFEAKQTDARTVLSPGETRTTVIKEADVNRGGWGRTTIENIHVFVDPAGLTLEHADTIRIKIADVGDSYADAVAIAKIG